MKTIHIFFLAASLAILANIGIAQQATVVKEANIPEDQQKFLELLGYQMRDIQSRIDKYNADESQLHEKVCRLVDAKPKVDCVITGAVVRKVQPQQVPIIPDPPKPPQNQPSSGKEKSK